MDSEIAVLQQDASFHELGYAVEKVEPLRWFITFWLFSM